MASTADTDAGTRLAQRDASPQAAAAAAVTLSAPQLHALFDILTHHETYREIQDFKDPDTIFSYGVPFAEKPASAAPESSNSNPNKDSKAGGSGGSAVEAAPSEPAVVTYAARSSTPILHMLFSKAVLSLPPAKTLPPAFWHVRVQRIIAQLAEAELSESYDQGALGTRKILATASSALIESLGRGALGGYPAGGRGRERGIGSAAGLPADRTYDQTDAAAFAQAWDDVLHAMVYGDLVDELFAHCAKTADIEQHSPAVKAAIDYIILHLAEFLHRIFVQSPNGKYLIKLVENVHQLAPYSVVRQTLRVSNAASMINGMLRVMLAKLSVGGLTNWMGITSAADDGMNLLQRIIALVMSYDSYNFKKATDKIEKAKDGPSRTQLSAIRDYMAQPRAHHEAVRHRSRETGRSMVVCILEAASSSDPALAASLTDAQHTQCAQYFAALLSIHDRREITNVFCRQNPDLFTQAVRDVMAALDPIIRGIHDKIDLKEHVTDFEFFINEFITISKSSSSPSSSPPTVKDYVNWMTGNRHMLYKWLHRVARDTPDIRDMFHGWAVETLKMFRADDGKTKEKARGAETTTRLDGGAGALDGELLAMFASLSPDVQKEVLCVLDEHAAYLMALDAAAAKERQALLDQIFCDDSGGVSKENNNSNNPGKKSTGSGRFSARWQDLMDDTLIGPGTKNGPLRRGREVANVMAPGKAASASSPSDIGSISSSIGSISSISAMAGSAASKWGRKADGFMSGFASAKSSRPPSPERISRKEENTRPPSGHVHAGPQPPNAAPVVEAMGDAFRQLLVERY